MRAPDFWSHRGLASALLLPPAALYAALGRLRWRLATPQDAGVPVVCVGNLVAGGAGKTPVAIAVARHLMARRIAVHFLSRGYGGTLSGPVRVAPERHGAAEVGDEPLLLAAVAPCWIARDRVAGAKEAVAAGADLIVMDDGHQNPGLRKTASLVVVDGETGFGNARVLPAGPLREPVAAGLARADAVIVIGTDRAGVAARLPAALPVLHGDLVPDDDARGLAGRAVFGFAGIGRPAKFRATLEGLGCTVAGWRAFPDHHPYRRSEIAAILRDAAAAGAIAVTTEKDSVRLPAELRDSVRTVGVHLVWRDPAQLDDILPVEAPDG
ncbi:MAG: tetraacyldisaccharide 4'-kinase [Rhodospirillales bacterium]|nr:MAG: tetraacyldisaccharide 4'-kinase [Rhodospirillales bacterium]